ncbi:MAG: malto-oligosyltrehalose trehalohydrolase [Desulfomonilaceae bacterium]
MGVKYTLQLGANRVNESICEFRVWAPDVEVVDVHIVSPLDRFLNLSKDTSGYHWGCFHDVDPGSLYFYRLDESVERPDPASRYQPHGVHGPSQVMDPNFRWTDDVWSGITLNNYIIYELHVGTFTPEGSFDSIIPCLERLIDLGVTAIELMPVAQFPGSRNWGYDGVYPYAVQNSYGGPLALKRLVDACHTWGLAVILDVVYNHLGPEGNYLADYGPYFTDRYRTPWGQAVNFDGPYSDEVRHFFISNALQWIDEYHIDALRIDAIHGIFDFSAFHFLQELAENVYGRADELGRKIHVIAESDLNDSRVVRAPELGGYGLSAQWNDDFHHAIHSILTEETQGYYQDFGKIEFLAKAFKEGFVYSGQRSEYRNRRHGNSSRSIPSPCFVVFSQNHDQIGNRPLGDRLTTLLALEALKLAAGLVILSPFTPLLFMGEEYGETAPFPYFVSHSDPDLVETIRRSRKEELQTLHHKGPFIDPQDEQTFQSAILRQELLEDSEHLLVFDFYKNLISTRKKIISLTGVNVEDVMVQFSEKFKYLVINRCVGETEFCVVFYLGSEPSVLGIPILEGNWSKLFDSSEVMWGGNGSQIGSFITSDGDVILELNPYCFVLFERV